MNRELSIMRTAFHNARKRTPPKVNIVPYFPMVKETIVRKGFLTDRQYADLRDALVLRAAAQAHKVGTDSIAPQGEAGIFSKREGEKSTQAVSKPVAKTKKSA